MFGRVMHVLCQFSSKMRKITLEHVLNWPNPAKFENREDTEIPRNSVKMTVYDLQNTKISKIKQPLFLIAMEPYAHLCEQNLL